MHLFVILSFLAVPPLFTAPVPKALRKVPNYDGVWQVVEFIDQDGGLKSAAVGKYWKIDGDKIGQGKAANEWSEGDLSRTLRTPDGQKPHLRELVVSDTVWYSCALELDGDTLRLAGCIDSSKTITECKPGKNVYYYEFKRVNK